MPFTLTAIDWAFDTHRRLGNFFPKFGNILDLCIAWEPPEQTTKPAQGGCSRCNWTLYVDAPEARTTLFRERYRGRVVKLCECVTRPELRERQDPFVGERIGWKAMLAKYVADMPDPRKFRSGNARMDMVLVQARALAKVKGE